VRAEMTFVLAETIDDVLPAALRGWEGVAKPTLLEMVCG
jgi:hypothetical protein